MNYKILTATLLCCLFTTVTKAQEPYWIQTFEDTIPASKDQHPQNGTAASG
jgi:hypothetical protein